MPQAAPVATDDLLDEVGVARYLGVRRSEVRRLHGDYQGTFPYPRRVDGDEPRWVRTELDEWLRRTGRRRPEQRRVAPQRWTSIVEAAPAPPPLLPALVAIGLTLAAALVLFAQRVSDRASNVDDYLYARQAGAFWRALSSGGHGLLGAWREFAINSPLVPTLAAPLYAIDARPTVLVLVDMPVLLALLLCVAGLMRLTGWDSRGRWLAAALVVVSPPVLTYAVMLNFSLAATLGLVGCVFAYGRSHRLRSRAGAAGVGVALGWLALSRVVAVVYIAALVVSLAVDLMFDTEDFERRAINGGIAAGSAGLIALPWWAVAGPSAWSYLTTAGYGNTVFTSQAPLWTRMTNRVLHTVDETGLILFCLVVVIFIAGTAAATVRTVRSEGRDESARLAVIGSICAAVAFAGLGTSSNAGTGFALPCLVLAAAIGVSSLRALVARARVRPAHLIALGAPLAAVASLVSVLLLVPQTPPTAAAHPLWLSGTPARAQFEQALGCRTACPLPDADALNRTVYTLIGSAPTLVLRDDAVVNPESLRFMGEAHGAPVALTAQDAAGALDPTLLDQVDFAIAGRTAAPYHAVDLTTVAPALRAAHWCLVLHRPLSPANSVDVWAAPGRAGCAAR